MRKKINLQKSKRKYNIVNHHNKTLLFKNREAIAGIYWETNYPTAIRVALNGGDMAIKKINSFFRTHLPTNIKVGCSHMYLKIGDTSIWLETNKAVKIKI